MSTPFFSFLQKILQYIYKDLDILNNDRLYDSYLSQQKDINEETYKILIIIKNMYADIFKSPVINFNTSSDVDKFFDDLDLFIAMFNTVMRRISGDDSKTIQVNVKNLKTSPQALQFKNLLDMQNVEKVLQTAQKEKIQAQEKYLENKRKEEEKKLKEEEKKLDNIYESFKKQKESQLRQLVQNSKVVTKLTETDRNIRNRERKIREDKIKLDNLINKYINQGLILEDVEKLLPFDSENNEYLKQIYNTYRLIEEFKPFVTEDDEDKLFYTSNIKQFSDWEWKLNELKEKTNFEENFGQEDDIAKLKPQTIIVTFKDDDTVVETFYDKLNYFTFNTEKFRNMYEYYANLLRMPPDIFYKTVLSSPNEIEKVVQKVQLLDQEANKNIIYDILTQIIDVNRNYIFKKIQQRIILNFCGEDDIKKEIQLMDLIKDIISLRAEIWKKVGDTDISSMTKTNIEEIDNYIDSIQQIESTYYTFDIQEQVKDKRIPSISKEDEIEIINKFNKIIDRYTVTKNFSTFVLLNEYDIDLIYNYKRNYEISMFVLKNMYRKIVVDALISNGGYMYGNQSFMEFLNQYPKRSDVSTLRLYYDFLYYISNIYIDNLKFDWNDFDGQLQKFRRLIYLLESPINQECLKSKLYNKFLFDIEDGERLCKILYTLNLKNVYLNDVMKSNLSLYIAENKYAINLNDVVFLNEFYPDLFTNEVFRKVAGIQKIFSDIILKLYQVEKTTDVFMNKIRELEEDKDKIRTFLSYLQVTIQGNNEQSYNLRMSNKISSANDIDTETYILNQIQTKLNKLEKEINANIKTFQEGEKTALKNNDIIRKNIIETKNTNEKEVLKNKIVENKTQEYKKKSEILKPLLRIITNTNTNTNTNTTNTNTKKAQITINENINTLVFKDGFESSNRILLEAYTNFLVTKSETKTLPTMFHKVLEDKIIKVTKQAQGIEENYKRFINYIKKIDDLINKYFHDDSLSIRKLNVKQLDKTFNIFFKGEQVYEFKKILLCHILRMNWDEKRLLSEGDMLILQTYFPEFQELIRNRLKGFKEIRTKSTINNGVWNILLKDFYQVDLIYDFENDTLLDLGKDIKDFRICFTDMNKTISPLIASGKIEVKMFLTTNTNILIYMYMTKPIGVENSNELCFKIFENQAVFKNAVQKNVSIKCKKIEIQIINRIPSYSHYFDLNIEDLFINPKNYMIIDFFNKKQTSSNESFTNILLPKTTLDGENLDYNFKINRYLNISSIQMVSDVQSVYKNLKWSERRNVQKTTSQEEKRDFEQSMFLIKNVNKSGFNRNDFYTLLKHHLQGWNQDAKSVLSDEESANLVGALPSLFDYYYVKDSDYNDYVNAQSNTFYNAEEFINPYKENEIEHAIYNDLMCIYKYSKLKTSCNVKVLVNLCNILNQTEIHLNELHLNELNTKSSSFYNFVKDLYRECAYIILSNPDVANKGSSLIQKSINNLFHPQTSSQGRNNTEMFSFIHQTMEQIRNISLTKIEEILDGVCILLEFIFENKDKFNTVYNKEIPFNEIRPLIKKLQHFIRNKMKDCNYDLIFPQDFRDTMEFILYIDPYTGPIVNIPKIQQIIIYFIRLFHINGSRSGSASSKNIFHVDLEIKDTFDAFIQEMIDFEIIPPIDTINWIKTNYTGNYTDIEFDDAYQIYFSEPKQVENLIKAFKSHPYPSEMLQTFGIMAFFSKTNKLLHLICEHEKSHLECIKNTWNNDIYEIFISTPGLPEYFQKSFRKFDSNIPTCDAILQYYVFEFLAAYFNFFMKENDKVVKSVISFNELAVATLNIDLKGNKITALERSRIEQEIDIHNNNHDDIINTISAFKNTYNKQYYEFEQEKNMIVNNNICDYKLICIFLKKFVATMKKMQAVLLQLYSIGDKLEISNSRFRQNNNNNKKLVNSTNYNEIMKKILVLVIGSLAATTVALNFVPNVTPGIGVTPWTGVSVSPGTGVSVSPGTGAFDSALLFANQTGIGNETVLLNNFNFNEPIMTASPSYFSPAEFGSFTDSTFPLSDINIGSPVLSDIGSQVLNEALNEAVVSDAVVMIPPSSELNSLLNEINTHSGNNIKQINFTNILEPKFEDVLDFIHKLPPQDANTAMMNLVTSSPPLANLYNKIIVYGPTTVLPPMKLSPFSKKKSNTNSNKQVSTFVNDDLLFIISHTQQFQTLQTKLQGFDNINSILSNTLQNLNLSQNTEFNLNFINNSFSEIKEELNSQPQTEEITSLVSSFYNQLLDIVKNYYYVVVLVGGFNVIFRVGKTQPPYTTQQRFPSNLSSYRDNSRLENLNSRLKANKTSEAQRLFLQQINDPEFIYNNYIRNDPTGYWASLYNKTIRS
jgi:hypothetical protein